ncbi:hypothetical protein Ac2012v2_004945 [Leucoagaricus gongylophorus]
MAQMPDEEAFSLLVRLMQVYDIRGHYLPEMPKLQMRLVNGLIFSITGLSHISTGYSSIV